MDRSFFAAEAKSSSISVGFFLFNYSTCNRNNYCFVAAKGEVIDNFTQ